MRMRKDSCKYRNEMNHCLVKDCRELEDGFGWSYTDDLLSAAEDLKVVGEEIKKKERCVEMTVEIACEGGEGSWVVETVGQCDARTTK